MKKTVYCLCIKAANILDWYHCTFSNTMMKSGIYFFFCLSLSSALVVHKRRIVETISVENGKLVRLVMREKHYEKWNSSESFHPSRNVVDDGQFGSNGGEDWTDAEVFLENGWPTAIDIRWNLF